MKWLTNMLDPRLEDAKLYVIRYYYYDETMDEAWDEMQEYLEGKIIGEPKATKRHSVEQLRAMNMVGIYSMED